MTRTMLLAGVAATALTVSGTARAQDVTLTLHHFLSPKSNAHTNMLVPWTERIEEASDGRIAIEIYPAMSLGGAPPQLVRQAADGVVDIVWTVNGYTPGLFPRSEAFELPTVFTNDAAAANVAMNEMFDAYLSEDYDGLKVLFLHTHAGQALHTVDTVARSVEDTAGMKLRVPGPTGNAVVEAMGATPVTMPVPDLPQSLATGVVDGALIPFEIIPPLQLQEVTNHQIEGPDSERFGSTVFQVSMNEDRWNELPDDLKQVFEEHSGPRWQREVGEIWTRADEEAIKMAVEAGNEHIVLTREEMDAFNEALRPVVDQWIAAHEGDFDAGAIVDEARELIETHSS